jgi:phosphopantetheine adenylyltransferase
MRVLIFGLPGSGKTYLAEKLVEYLGDKVAWFNADKVREEADDWDFSDEGRLRQNQRMIDLCVNAEVEGKIAIADFVAPFESARNKFFADYEIFVDTIEEGRFEDTNKVFQRPVATDYNVQEQRGDVDAKIIAYEIGQRFIWNNRAPTTQMLGRFQPWHPGHQALFDRAMAKHEQVVLMVRDMPTDDSNPYPAYEVIENLQQSLCEFAGKVKIEVVPNILNITYGRGVGYKIEQEVFDDATHDISATKIREQMRKEGKL